MFTRRHVAIALWVVVSVFLLIGIASAKGGGEGNNTHCNGVGNPNSPCEGTTNNGGTGGSAHSNAKSNAKSSAKSLSFSASGAAATSQTTVHNKVETRIDGPKYNVPSLGGSPAPSVSGGSDYCLGSWGIQAVGPMAGLGVGGTKKDVVCQALRTAKYWTDMADRAENRQFRSQLLSAALYLSANPEEVTPMEALQYFGLFQTVEVATPTHEQQSHTTTPNGDWTDNLHDEFR